MLLTGMCFYQNICTLPFYMDIAFLCLINIEFLNCVLTFSQQRSVIFVIFIFGFLNIPEILSQSENDSSEELSCEYSVWHHSQYCCCVQCDCCGFYGEDNKYIRCVLCTCGFLSRVMIIQ